MIRADRTDADKKNKVDPKMRPLLCKLLPAALLILAAGCVNVDYVGQTFPPIPEGQPVTYFSSRNDIQPGKYRIIGRAVITTMRRFDKYDIRELLIDEARRRGADAVVLVGHKIVRRGVYERDDDVSANDTAPSTKSGNVTPGGEPLEVSLDNPTKLEGEHHYRLEIELRVLFLKDREALEQELARRGRELDRLVKQPDPAQSPSAEKPKTAPPQAPQAPATSETSGTPESR